MNSGTMNSLVEGVHTLMKHMPTPESLCSLGIESEFSLEKQTLCVVATSENVTRASWPHTMPFKALYEIPLTVVQEKPHIHTINEVANTLMGMLREVPDGLQPYVEVPKNTVMTPHGNNTVILDLHDHTWHVGDPMRVQMTHASNTMFVTNTPLSAGGYGWQLSMPLKDMSFDLFFRSCYLLPIIKFGKFMGLHLLVDVKGHDHMLLVGTRLGS